MSFSSLNRWSREKEYRCEVCLQVEEDWVHLGRSLDRGSLAYYSMADLRISASKNPASQADWFLLKWVETMLLSFC